MNTHVHPTSMNIFKRLRPFDLEIHKISHQERFIINGDIIFH
jgi:hypothetical protein